MFALHGIAPTRGSAVAALSTVCELVRIRRVNTACDARVVAAWRNRDVMRIVRKLVHILHVSTVHERVRAVWRVRVLYCARASARTTGHTAGGLVRVWHRS